MNSIEKILAEINSKIQNALENEVAETVIDTMQEVIQEDVYNTYQPEYYKRRYHDNGLIDRDNIHIDVAENSITLKNEAILTGGEADFKLDEAVVYGYGGLPAPRDFYSSCRERLNDTGRHVKALKKGLRRQGIDVR